MLSDSPLRKDVRDVRSPLQCCILHMHCTLQLQLQLPPLREQEVRELYP